jgi:KDO2-lipid IV(A) lauroyltransferase
MTSHAATLLGISRFPLRTRRRLLRAAWSAGRLTGRLPPIGVAGVLRDALRVSGAEAVRLEHEVIFHDWMTVLEWASLTSRATAALREDSELIRSESAATLARLARDGRPIILAPIHMGCFALPLARIMYDHFASRRMLILRAREDRHDETVAMRRVSEIGVDMRFLNVAEKQNYIDAVKFAKAGSIIVMFVDLPASYGGAAPVSLFGKSAQLAMGIGSLARVTDATVVPISICSTVRGDTVRVGRPFETFAKGHREKERIAGIVRLHIEESVRDNPAQWHMWPRFAEFLDNSVHDEAA